MSKLLFHLRAVVEHPPRSLADDQDETILKEVPWQVTARTAEEAKNQVFEHCLSHGEKLVHLEITDKQETR